MKTDLLEMRTNIPVSTTQTCKCTNSASPTTPTRCGARSFGQDMPMWGSSNAGTRAFAVALPGCVTFRRYENALMLHLRAQQPPHACVRTSSHGTTVHYDKTRGAETLVRAK